MQSNECSILDFSNGIMTFLFHIVSCINYSACESHAGNTPQSTRIVAVRSEHKCLESMLPKILLSFSVSMLLWFVFR